MPMMGAKSGMALEHAAAADAWHALANLGERRPTGGGGGRSRGGVNVVRRIAVVVLRDRYPPRLSSVPLHLMVE